MMKFKSFLLLFTLTILVSSFFFPIAQITQACSSINPHQMLFETDDYVVYGDEMRWKTGLFSVSTPRSPWNLMINGSVSWDSIRSWSVPLYTPRENGIVTSIYTVSPGFMNPLATFGEFTPHGLEASVIKAGIDNKTTYIGHAEHWNGPSALLTTYGAIKQVFRQQEGQLGLTFESTIFGLHNVSHSIILKIEVKNRGNLTCFDVPILFHLMVGHPDGKADTYGEYDQKVEAVLTNSSTSPSDLAIGFKGAAVHGWQIVSGTDVGPSFRGFTTPLQLWNNSASKDSYIGVILQHNLTLAPGDSESWWITVVGDSSRLLVLDKLVMVRKLDLDAMMQETINYYDRRLKGLLHIETGYPLIDALSKNALYELYANSEYEWRLYPGPMFWKVSYTAINVYTRDTAWSAYLMPFYNQTLLTDTLLSRIADGMIVQDGQVFNEVDGVIAIWALWELYLSTANRQAIERFYPAVNNTLRWDYVNIRDNNDSLVYGFSGGPWTGDDMRVWGRTIKDLWTNLEFIAALSRAMKMAYLLGHDRDYEFYKSWRDHMVGNITRFQKGGRWIMAYNSTLVIERNETAGIAFLADELGIDAMDQVHFERFGVPFIYPPLKKAGEEDWTGWFGGSMAITAAHLSMAANKLGKTALLREIFMRETYWRATQLTHSDYGNAKYEYGHSGGMGQSWSASGYLSMIVCAMAGIRPTEGGLRISPCIPAGFSRISVVNLPFRGHRYNITIVGTGTSVRKIEVDGIAYSGIIMPLGDHDVKVYMGLPKFNCMCAIARALWRLLGVIALTILMWRARKGF